MERYEERKVLIPARTEKLKGIFYLPPERKGVVVFAHGSGSGRFSPRNQLVARFLQAGGIATLLTDLLTAKEAANPERVFDIDLLAERLLANSNWVRQQPGTGRLPLGFFGSSTGAAAALEAAAESREIAAVVSRGGRPDLASKYLSRVQAPTLLIVGGEDRIVAHLNREALGMLNCPKELKIVPGASHLFEEPGALNQVAQMARDWFLKHFQRKGEETMAEKEYKQFTCRTIGMDCDFLVRAATRDEAMRLATEHACEDHKICEITPEFKEKMANSIRDIWCRDGECGYAPRESEIPYYI